MATRTIARIFGSYSDAAAAVRDLEAAGFAADDISMVARGANGDPVTTDAHSDGDAATGGGTGATIGGVIGGGAGLLAGIGALAIPGLGPVVAAGWLVATLAGAGVGAAAGGLLGALTGAGFGEDEAEAYAEGVRRGGNLVTVRTEESRVAEAEAVMRRHNAEQGPAVRGRWDDANWARTDGMADPALGRSSARTGAGLATDSSFGAPDGTPGNPPGTMISRGVDEVAGTNISGAHPENERSSGSWSSAPDGTRDNPPGTKASRGFDDVAGTNVSGARPENERSSGSWNSAPDGTPGNPPGTKVSRGIDEVAGTNISGAHPENDSTVPRRNPEPRR